MKLIVIIFGIFKILGLVLKCLRRGCFLRPSAPANLTRISWLSYFLGEGKQVPPTMFTCEGLSSYWEGSPSLRILGV